jgi:Arc/MetJ family transcription regulator
MPTNIEIDDKLLNEALKLSKHTTKWAAVNEALAEYIRRHKQALLVDLFGTVEFDGNYHYKSGRKRQIFPPNRRT